MSGETELEDYDDMRITTEDQNELDLDIQDIIMRDIESELSSRSPRDSRFGNSQDPKPKGIHYRCQEFVPTRRVAMLQRNNIIRHRNKLVR